MFSVERSNFYQRITFDSATFRAETHLHTHKRAFTLVRGWIGFLELHPPCRTLATDLSGAVLPLIIFSVMSSCFMKYVEKFTLCLAIHDGHEKRWRNSPLNWTTLVCSRTQAIKRQLSACEWQCAATMGETLSSIVEVAIGSGHRNESTNGHSEHREHLFIYFIKYFCYCFGTVDYIQLECGAFSRRKCKEITIVARRRPQIRIFCRVNAQLTEQCESIDKLISLEKAHRYRRPLKSMRSIFMTLEFR